MAWDNPYALPEYSDPDALENNPLINNFATRGALTGLQYLGETLSKPMNAAFGFAGGLIDGDPLQAVKELANLVPFSDTVGLTNNSDPNSSIALTKHRVGGRDLLRKAGLADSEDNWGNFAGGLALELAADPLAWVKGPLGALTKAGVNAEKAGTLSKHLTGRIAAGEGGWLGLTNKPWYAEMLPGAAPAEVVSLLGTGGKRGLQASQALDSGISAATRWNIPGTEISPIAMMRSAFEKGAGNMTGYGPIVDELGGGYGKSDVAGMTRKFESEARATAYPLHEAQSEALNALGAMGMDKDKAAKALYDAGVTSGELNGAMKIPEGLNPAQEAIVKQYAEKIRTGADPIYGKPAVEDLVAHGIQVNESSNVWNHDYMHRQQAGMGDNIMSQQMQRESMFTEVPGGAKQIDDFAKSKYASAVHKETDPVKLAEMREAYKAEIRDGIIKEGNANISRNFDRFRSLGKRTVEMPSVSKKVPGQLIDTPEERVLQELERSFGLEPKPKFGDPTTIEQYAPNKWGGRHKLNRIDQANATPEQIAWLRDRKAAERALEIVSNPKETDALAGKLADFFMNADPKVAERGYLYRKDLASNAQSYGEHMARQKAMNIGIMNVISKEVKPLAAGVGKASDMLTMKEAIDELGMMGAERMLLDKVKAAKIGPNGQPMIEDLTSGVVPKKLVDKLKLEKAGPQSTPQGIISKISNAFRYGVTVPFPANFVRNYTGETANTAISGTNPFRGLGDTISHLNNTLTDPVKRAATLEADKAGRIGGILGIDQVKQMLGDGVTKNGDLMLNVAPTPVARSTKQIAKDFAEPMFSEAARSRMDITPMREIMGVPSGQPPSTIAGKIAAFAGDKVIDPFRGYMGAMETAHAFQNNMSRHQAISQLMREGYTPAAAAERVRVTQRDYQELSPFEQKFMRNVVPFYNFSKANLKSQADTLSRQPGRYNAMLSTINSGRGDDNFVPSWASSGTAIPLPGAPEGQQRLLGNLGLPVEDETIGALGALLSLHPIEALRRAASASNPLMKTPYEMATGRQIFSGRDLADLRPSPAISGVLGDNEFSRGLTQAISGTPFSRAFSTTDRLMSTERNGVLATLLNLGTGIRTVDFDENQTRNLAARQKVEELMKASGQFGSRQQVYLKPELRGQEETLSPEVQQLMAVHDMLLKKAQDAAKAKAAAAR